MGNNPELQSEFFTPKPELSPEQLAERSFDLNRLFQISQVRESALPQFDGMGYSRYNETNEMADMSFLPPKKNKGDSRITTGITHEKDSSLTALFLSMNLEGSVRIFHHDREDYELGTAITKLARKSRDEEFYDDKRPSNYRNLVVQGTSFTVEQYEEMWLPNKEISTKDIDPTMLDQVQWIDRGLKKVKAGCVSNLIDGKKVFMENIREKDIQKQPGVYTVEYVPREIMKAIWGKTKMWQYVPYMINPSSTSVGTLSQASIYSDWVYGEIDFNKCEVINVYRPFEQRFQKYINGVPMLLPKFPLKAVSPSGLIPIAKGDLSPINLFAYSKSMPAKTKIDQAVFDEQLNLMVVKSRQAAFVPRVNNTDKVLTPEMFLGGKMIANVEVENIAPLIQNPGITQADFSFYKLFEEQIESKTISSMLEGEQGDGGGVSVDQYLDMEKKQMLKIGGYLDGLMNWERQMLRLRVMNLLYHGGVVDENTKEYKSVTMSGAMSDGTSGLSIMKFQSPVTKTSKEVFDEQNQYRQQNGQQAEIAYIDPELLKSIPDDDSYYICYDVIPVQKGNDRMAMVMFQAEVTAAAQLFGPESLQVDSLKRQFAAIMHKSYDDVFASAQDLQAKQQLAAAQAAQQQQQGQNFANNAKPAIVASKPVAPIIS